MSRTKKGNKGPGHEYWSRRPGNFMGGKPGRATKKETHQIERARAKRAVKKDKE